MSALPKVCLIAAMTLAAAAAAAADIQDHLMSGSKFVQEKKYKEARREFENAVTLDPENADANLLLGLTLANEGELERALPYTLKSVQLRPAYSGHYNLGLIYANQGKYTEAAEAYGQAVKLNPSSTQAWYQLGLVYASDLKFDKAVEAYGKAIELDPKFAQAYQGLGSASYWSGDKETAIRQVERLKELKLDAPAQELELWVKNKESKKAKSAARSAPAGT